MVMRALTLFLSFWYQYKGCFAPLVQLAEFAGLLFVGSAPHLSQIRNWGIELIISTRMVCTCELTGIWRALEHYFELQLRRTGTLSYTLNR